MREHSPQRAPEYLGRAMATDKIQSITIEGFKSIRSIKDFPLRPINILIGANGSGKSNFLEAFVFLGEANEGQRAINSYVATRGGAEALLHFGSKNTLKIHISARSSNGAFADADCLYTLNDNLALVKDIRLNYTSGGFALKVPSFERYRFHDTGDHSPIKKTNLIDDNRSLRQDGSNLAAFLYLLQQRYADSYSAIRRTVRQVAPFFEDFQLESLRLNPNTIKLEWRHKRSDEYWDASAFSDGTLRFIALATLLLQPVELHPSVILVDEPELGLHPYAIGMLASLIRQASKETQVIVATQSPLLLDYFEPEDILVADRVDGATTIERLRPEPLAEWLKEYSLGQLWEKGELGGRPGKEYR
jgi:predicted ATPase